MEQLWKKSFCFTTVNWYGYLKAVVSHQDTSPLSVQWRLEERQRWISDTPWPNLETGAGPADQYLPSALRALWSECPSEEDWHFRHFPLWVRTNWPYPRPHPSILPKICREMSANMATGCWSGDQAVGLGRRPLLDGWFCGINRTEDLTCTAVDRWRIKRRRLFHSSVSTEQYASSFSSSSRLCPSTAGCSPPSMSSIVVCLLLFYHWWDFGLLSTRCPGMLLTGFSFEVSFLWSFDLPVYPQR